MSMQNGNITSINWNANNFFSGYVLDNNIYTYTGELIGVNLAKYQEVKAGLQKCRDKLVELGVIVPEKTPEEIIKEQSELLQKQSEICNTLMAQMQEMNTKLEGIKNEYRPDKIDNTIITAAGTDETKSYTGSKPDGKNSKPGNELHKGRGVKNPAAAPD